MKVMNAPTPPIESPPRWSLEDLYSNRGDPRIEADLAAGEASARELATLEGALVTAHAEPARLGSIASGA